MKISYIDLYKGVDNPNIKEGNTILGAETKWITEEEFNQKIKEYSETLDSLFAEGKDLENSIKSALGSLKYE